MKPSIRLTKCLFLLLAIPVIARAQADPAAKAVLDGFLKQVNSSSAILADFTFTHINIREQSSDSQSGQITLKGTKFRLIILSSEIFFDGQTLWNYLPDANEVTISEPGENDEVILQNPFRIITAYEQRYRYSYVGEIREKGNILHEIDLFPINLQQEYSRIKIKIEKNSQNLVSARFMRKDGDHYLVEIDRFSSGTTIPDSHFVFSVKDHPGVEVIDLR